MKKQFGTYEILAANDYFITRGRTWPSLYPLTLRQSLYEQVLLWISARTKLTLISTIYSFAWSRLTLELLARIEKPFFMLCLPSTEELYRILYYITHEQWERSNNDKCCKN